MTEPRPAPVRGEHEITLPMPWRLDGSTDDPTAPLVLCLHGQGMDEDSFALLLQGLFDLPVRFVIPRGPYPVEVRRERRVGGAWYAYDGDAERFRRELGRTEAIVLGLLRSVEAERGLRPRRRFLLGFSQGGYCGAYVAVSNADVFDGMIVSGARVKTEFLTEAMPRAASRGFRALLLHNRDDRSVPPEGAERSRRELGEGGVEAELRLFDGGHTLGRAQVGAIREWLEGSSK